MKHTKIINIFGAPGAGKSTGAAYIFSLLKMRGVDAELVTEFAKDKVWEENPTPFKNQAYMFGKQAYRIARCEGKVDVIVTDSPLPLSIHYNHDPKLTENFNKTVMDIFSSYDNECYFLYRVKPYNPNGRHQTEAQSDAMAEDIESMLNNLGIDYMRLAGTKDSYDWIVNKICKELNVD